MNQNPFSFYDFLGYLIPGGFFILLMYFCGLTFDLDIVVDLTELLKGQSQIFGVLNYASIVIISYIAGHFISITSAFFIEKYMNEKLGYPSQYLFNKLSDDLEIVCTPSCCEQDEDIKRKIKYRIIKAVLLPITPWDYATQKLCYSQSLPFQLANTTWQIIKDGYEKKFRLDNELLKVGTGLHDDLFRLAYHYVYEFSNQHQSKIQNYVALYGFCRNICLVFIITFWISFLTFIFRLVEGNSISYSLVSVLLSFFFVYVFYVGFVKFYRRYTLEVLMAFAVLQRKDNIN
ncbi:hypothetical protein E2A40_22915 [Salmonella enterica subsp. enterica serovar Johannesburg]|uniref:Uncharacterized protein n=2 Tax=Salmonella enterica TaxID=28901 RepID=A0A5U5UGQ3_SALER|nr:hypothetical protein [Salmonella enterica]EAA7335311.1 hypothetical protein [Salmonella enterica subsp. enterica]ECA0616293.1 hypothetical protein [Salmonella enterica subsp. enterica serovar Brandenburg]ECH8772173.1 hypothetical protein [Salmonella enterica subsp. enterica serovar Hvittingfoss]EDI1788251.1 hypothetical protein [Salmonella enterica subsp. enterica serovar Dublin]EDK6105148.1 hypothetical protein [Salmonella enterica subsp. enterica serovar Newport]EDQ5334213.1 hypothetical